MPNATQQPIQETNSQTTQQPPNNTPILVQNNLDMERLSCWKLWFAEYNGGPEYRCSIQQITDSGIVRGITGDVHIDIAYENNPK